MAFNPLDPTLLLWAAALALLGLTLYFAKRHLGEMPRLAAYIEIFRPFTLVAPLVAGTSFGLMGAASVKWVNFDVVQLVYGVGALVLVNAASNTLNAVHDLEIDRINKPYRPLPRGIVDPHEAATVAFLLYLITLFRAQFINLSFAVFVYALVFLTIAYSAPPLRFKKRFVINNLSIALARSFVGVLAAWSIFGNPFDRVPWGVGLVLFIFLFGAATTKDFTDIKGDAAYAVRTFPVVLGVPRAATMTAAFFVVPIAFIPLLVQLHILQPSSNYLMFLFGWGGYVFIRTKDWASTKDPKFENNPMWAQMYFLLMALAVGFALVYILLPGAA